MNGLRKTCAWCEQWRPLATALLTGVAVIVCGFGALNIWFWVIDDRPVVAFLGGEIVPVAARPDELVIVYMNIQKNRNCPGTTQRRLSGSCGEHLLSSAPTYLSAGFLGRVTLPFQVPREAIPGPCAFVIHTRFFCNPLDQWRPRTYHSIPIPFKVLRYDE